MQTLKVNREVLDRAAGLLFEKDEISGKEVDELLGE
jgi:ATP-dependent Zn protease